MNRSILGLSLLLAACGGGSASTAGSGQIPTAPGGSRDPSKWPADDKSMCDFKGKPDVEVSETSGPGALKPNVRRVYKTYGDGDTRHKVLICREIDSNLDGIKDVVRTFNTKGEAVHEEADRNFDGRIDIWINFVDGRMAEEDSDTNNDGKADVWKFYVDGDLNRIRRDRNFDGKADVWEMYSKGRLDRMGFDETYDGHVDRWDRDTELKYEAETAEKEARAKLDEAEKADGGPPPNSNGQSLTTSSTTGAGGSNFAAREANTADAGAPPPKKTPTPKKK